MREHEEREQEQNGQIESESNRRQHRIGERVRMRARGKRE